ncbi:MAG: N-6 DNA methylase [Candidatus Obscuribacterales bacterium]|nr:N-6 DNA methylase [Candidatus Obscuribacterales bacterium]
MTATMSRIAIQKAVNDFRLRAGSVILSNQLNTKSIQTDIDCKWDIAELSEQYSLLIYLNWIAIKLGFPTYKTSIDQGCEAAKFPLLSWSCLANQYPFHEFALNELSLKDADKLYQFLDNNFQTDLFLAGEIYQKTLAQNQGEYYTPAWVVACALERAFTLDLGYLLHKLKKDSDFSIMDPACGSGNFLLGTIQWLQQNNFDQKFVASFAANNLYGQDIDGKAISLCRILLLLCQSSYLANSPEQIETIMTGLAKNILVKNSLLEATIKKEKSRKFDLILGNPPYISFGSRNQDKLAPSWQKYLKKSFAHSAEYKIRLHSIFQEIAINWTKAEGQIAFLLPDAFLNGSYYHKLRRLILERCQILSLSELPEDTIAATVGRWCIAHYKVTDGKKSEPVQLYKLHKNKNSETKWSNFILPIALLAAKDKARFQLVFSSTDAELLELLASAQFLGYALSGHTGIRARHGQTSIIAKEKRSECYQPGIISGAQLTPYKISPQNDWLQIDPKLLFAGGFNPEIIGKNKILLRQTADRFIAAIDKDGLYHLNNVHSFVTKTNDPHELAYYCGLLNSSLYLHIYRLKSREDKRALAQIDIEMVESMPLPAPDLQKQNMIADFVSLLQQNPQTDQPHQRAIDSLVYSLFKISAAQIIHIEQSTGQSLPLPSLLECETLLNLSGVSS